MGLEFLGVSSQSSGLRDLSRPGTLTVAAGVARLPFGVAAKLLGATAALGTAPGTDVLVDLNKNGSTLFPTQSQRPKVAAGVNVGAEQPLNVDIAAGDYLTIDVDQIGGVPAASSPQFVATSTDIPAYSNVTSPARPTGAASGDVHLAYVQGNVDGTTGSEPATVVTPPAGWTLIGSAIRRSHASGSTDFESRVYWLRDNGSNWATGWTFTNPAVNAYARARIVTYRNIIGTGDPIDASAQASTGQSLTSWTGPTLTAATANALLVMFASIEGTDITFPGTMTERGSSANLPVSVADELRPSTGAVGARTVTGSQPSGFTVYGTAHMISLKPIVAASVPGADLTVSVRYALV
jgi:hypothetical protein